MTYCPECGSEVAPENTFCAYCGIALTPIVPLVESETTDDQSFTASVANEELNSKDPAQNDESAVLSKTRTAEELTDEATPTVMASDNQTPENDWSARLDEPDKTESAKQKSIVEILQDKVSEDFSSVESGNLQLDDSAATSSEGTEISFDSKIENSGLIRDLNSSDNLGFANAVEPESEQVLPTPVSDDLHAWDEFPNQNVAPKAAEIESNREIKPEQYFSKPDEFENAVNSEFEATIPYTPKDFAKQDLQPSTSGRAEEAEKEKVSEAEVSETISSGESKAAVEPIAKPDIPVGSSANDSLEPRLVSVQIYNPAEKPENIEEEKEEESIYDSQTLLKHPGVPQEQAQQKAEAPREPRSFTSPNMGRDDTAGKSKAKLKPLDEGTVLNGRYEVIRKIGGGGMGAVYLASDRNLGGVLRAVKEMVQSYIEDAQQEKAVNDFKRESLLLTSLEHQAIPTIFDYFYDEKEGRFYLVMKYISGGDLAGRMRSAPEGRLDEELVTEWGIQIADVLNYLHNRQPPIIYRDLKPSNVMIDGNNGRIMLIDFGIARWVNKEERGVTAVGTMGYAPPELFSGNVEPRSDIYSLGSTMFHLLTGADPQSNPLLIFDFHKNPRPRQINPNLSDQIEKILLRMVEYNAEKRFTSAAELRDALIKHRENLKSGAVSFGSSPDAAVLPAPVNELVFCGFCGQKIVASDVFCPFCGAQQPLAGKGAASLPVYTPPKLTARVLVLGTNELDTPMFNLEKDTNLVGRRDPMSNIFPEVDLSKFDPQTKISRKHARIWRETNKYMVEDLGSSNGTILIPGSSEPLRLGKNQPHVLNHGDKLRVGDTTLHFVLS